jgi:hypothetical protein
MWLMADGASWAAHLSPRELHNGSIVPALAAGIAGGA